MRRIETHHEVKEKTNLGLCSTCISIKTCTGRKTWKGPVLFCEEFCDIVPLTNRQRIKPESAAPQTSPAKAAADEREVQFKGLCMNCESRHTCCFPKPETGVWHCEEYR
jgi:hypothetical protein